MAELAFYFDPLCPWAWLTSLWVREVRNHRPVDVEWRFFSLAEVNELDPVRYGPLRIAAQARREGGNDAVDRAYLALGRMIHERHVKFETLEQLQAAAGEVLAEAGLDPEIARRALTDESTLDDVRADHAPAKEDLAAFGVPWLVLDGEKPGFFGPVVGERLRGEEAAQLWDHFTWMSAQPYLYELKRGRQSLPDLDGLSADFRAEERVR